LTPGGRQEVEGHSVQEVGRLPHQESEGVGSTPHRRTTQ